MAKNQNDKKQRNYKPLLGILELFVVASIFLMTAIILLGTDELTKHSITAPAVVWASYKLVQRFSK